MEIFWIGLLVFGKPYRPKTLDRDYKVMHSYWFRWYSKRFDKKFGYAMEWYDGPHHFFTIWPVTFCWSHDAIPAIDEE